MKEGPQDGEDGTPRRRLCEQCREPCDSGFICLSCPVNDGNDQRFHVCGNACQLELWKNHKKEHKRKRDRERQRKIRASKTDEEKQSDAAARRRRLASRTSEKVHAVNAKMRQLAEAMRASRTNEEVQADSAAKRQKRASRTEEEVQADKTKMRQHAEAMHASRTEEEVQADNAKMRQHAEAMRASRTEEGVRADNVKRQHHEKAKRASRTNEEVQADNAARRQRSKLSRATAAGYGPEQYGRVPSPLHISQSSCNCETISLWPDPILSGRTISTLTNPVRVRCVSSGPTVRQRDGTLQCGPDWERLWSIAKRPNPDWCPESEASYGWVFYKLRLTEGLARSRQE